MARFSKISKERLASCHPWLQDLFNEVIKYVDCAVLEGHRGKVKQLILYQEGKTQLTWPDSLHNRTPSMAVDVIPYPVSWEDAKRFYLFVGFVRGVASQMKIPIRCGADWDSDFDIQDQTFFDLVHFELAT